MRKMSDRNAHRSTLTQRRVVSSRSAPRCWSMAKTGRLNRAWLKTLVADLLRLRRRGQQVILVSSGAVALGRRHLRLPAGALRLEESQAAAAVGQIRLAHAYKELLEEAGVTVAQMLLTLEDSEQRTRYLNARATLEALLAIEAMPVINENDTVATAEIRYGDNDRLAARVAQMAGADCLVLLSDVDGLYTADPNRDPKARFIERVLQDHARDRGDGGARAVERWLGRHGHQDHGGAHRAQCRLSYVHRRRQPACIRSDASSTVRAAPGSCRRPRRWRRASNGSPARCVRPERCTSMPGRCVRCAAARACCPPASPAPSAGSKRRYRQRAGARRGRDRARHRRLFGRRLRPASWAARAARSRRILGFRGPDELIHRDDLVILQHDHAPAAASAAAPLIEDEP